MLRYLIKGIYQGLQTALSAESPDISHGFTPDISTYEHVRFAQSVADAAVYDSCDRYQRFSFLVDSFSLSDTTAIERITKVVDRFEKAGVTLDQGSYIQMWKGAETLEEDPDRAEDGSIIWKASVIMTFEIANERID